MALTPQLNLKQSQQLVMTPQLQQAIKLLQYSNIELQEFVAAEVEKNPLLEVGEGESLPDAPNEELAEGDGDELMGLKETDDSIMASSEAAAAGDTPLDTNYQVNVFSDDSEADLPANMREKYQGDDRGIDEILGAKVDLHTFLMRQMPVVVDDEREALIAAHVIDLVDAAGYVNSDDLIDLSGRLGISVEEMESILIRLQSLEPTGVFARDLNECLALQLKEIDHLDPAMVEMLDHLDLLAKRDFAALKELCDVDTDDLVDMISEIKTLNPKPGLAFEVLETQGVTPDVFVRKNEMGAWVVELNTETLPKVLVNEEYIAELKENTKGGDTSEFITSCLTNANWLVKALEQRANTILKVSAELVIKQKAFFEHGVKHLKPMTLKDIADEIEMHESTVSRVTNGKFMATPRGMFELKYFFSSSISATEGGEAHASESVKSRIKDLIDAEDPKKILSDAKLVALLEEDGISIARRTVVKYREAMHIPSSVQRRREKNASI